ncbi:MAG: oxidoreductase [Gammaproteobacteria bacterium]
MSDTSSFRALRIHQDDDGISSRMDTLALDDLSDGDVVIRAQYSGINYKDALAATGAGRILRRFPLVGGIDVAGEVESSTDDRFSAGDPVVVTGCGLSEDRDGGYAEFVRVPGDSVIAIPDGLDPYQVMCLGTAGFTAALAVSRLEHNGLTPDSGTVAITGATGGVGSLALNMLSGLGYRVTAITGKADADDFLKNLGATEILRRQDVDFGKRPLEKPLWAGAIDNLGGQTLTWLTRTVDWWGSIASIGLAESHELNTTVIPFILRGINLLGINSVATPRDIRLQVWERLAGDLRPTKLDVIGTRTVTFDNLADVFDDYLQGRVTGRTVVDLTAR